MSNEKCPECQRDLETAVNTSSLFTCPACKALIVPENATHVSLIIAPDAKPDPAAPLSLDHAPVALSLSVHFLRHYRLSRVLGYGAASTVYLARTNETNQQVAIKFLTAIDDKALLDRFLSEGRMMTDISHPNVVAVTEVNELEGHPYLVTEYIDGGTLADRIAKGRIPVGAAIGVALDALTGLDVLHKRGILHRDLKPANVLLTKAGKAKLTDLGLAKDTAREGEPLTQAGTVVGTPLYMAPEQLKGEPATVACDLYAMGSILHEMLAGVPPYQGKSLVDLLPMKLTQDAPPITEKEVPGCPESLSRLVARALRREPGQRPSSATEFATELIVARNALSPQEAGASIRMTRGTRSVRKPSGRTRVLTASPRVTGPTPVAPRTTGQAPIVERVTGKIAAVLAPSEGSGSFLSLAFMLVAIGLGAAWYEAGMPLPYLNGTESPSPSVTPQPDRTPAPPVPRSPSGRAGHVGVGGSSLRSSADAGSPRPTPSASPSRFPPPSAPASALPVPSASPSPQPAATASVGPSPASAPSTVPSSLSVVDLSPQPDWGRLRYRHDGPIQSAFLADEGRKVISCGQDGTIRVWDVTTGAQTQTVSCTVTPVRASLAPDGRLFAVGGDDGSVVMIDLNEGQVLFTIKPIRGAVRLVAFVVDGSYLLVGGDDGILAVCDPTDGKTTCALAGHKGPVEAAAMGGSGVITGGSDRTIRVWNVATGKEIRKFVGDAGPVRAMAISADGRVLASGARDGSLKLWNVAAGVELRTLAGHKGGVSAAAFGPTGAYVVTGGDDGSVRVWKVDSGKMVRSIPAHAGSVVSVAISPDRTFLLSAGADGTLRFFGLRDGRELRTGQGHSGAVTSVTVDPRSKLILSGSSDGLVVLWDAKTGHQIKGLRGHADAVLSVSFTPDLRWVLSTGADGTTRLWEVLTGRSVREFSGHVDGVAGAALSPDGKLVVSGGLDHKMKIWDAATGRELLAVDAHAQRVSCVAISSDGKTAVTGSWDQTLKLWELPAGRPIATLTGHTHYVLDGAFSPAGDRLVSSSADKTVKIWDPSTGKEILSLSGPGGAVETVGLSPDGKIIWGGDDSGLVRLWDAASGKELATFKLKGVTRWCGAAATVAPSGAVSFVLGTERGWLKTYQAGPVGPR